MNSIVSVLQNWLDENRGSAFCLIQAADFSVVSEIYKRSHGFVPNHVIEVRNNIVEIFIIRIQDPEHSVVFSMMANSPLTN